MPLPISQMAKGVLFRVQQKMPMLQKVACGSHEPSQLQDSAQRLATAGARACDFSAKLMNEGM
jgi:hypothetical protein